MLAKVIQKEAMRLLFTRFYSFSTFYRLKQLDQVSLTKKVKYNAPFFKKNWRNQDFMITERIKRSKKTEEIESIIQSVGMQMNIVHLTAILDRVEQQQMLNIIKIINFVVNSLKNHQDFFINITQDRVRTISNIICYLGNIKNKELNYIFQRIDLRLPLIKGNTIERTMLITGLIRLQLFESIFHTNSQSNKQKLTLSDVIGTEFSLTQVLSIWYAYIIEINHANKVVNDFFMELVNQLDYKKQENHQITLISFAYSTICYTKIYKTLTFKSVGKVFNIVSQGIPQSFIKQHMLQPHEYSLLLESIKRLKEYRKQEKQQITYSNRFKKVLEQNFREICLLKNNITLRNVANCYKSFNEFFGITQAIIQYSMAKMSQIILQQTSIIQKKPSYSFNEKIDLLSLCSLFWKISEQYDFKSNSSEQKIYLHEKFIRTAISFLKQLDKRDLMHKFSNKELLMLYSGFYQLTRTINIDYDDELMKLSVREVIKEERAFTVKEITLFFSYFRLIRFITPQFCQFVKKSLEKMKMNSDFDSNPKARQILTNKTCIMNSQRCLNCFSPLSTNQIQSEKAKQ